MISVCLVFLLLLFLNTVLKKKKKTTTTEASFHDTVRKSSEISKKAAIFSVYKA